MSRTSAFRGTWSSTQRPHVVVASDSYVALQGESSLVGCGECRKEVQFNRYITQISTEGSVDSPPGSATVTLSIPDTDINDFYVDGQFIIISMMEIEIFGKGYFSVGGLFPYYKMFWGLVSSVTSSWDNGVRTVQLSCKDMLRWWEVTNVTLNPAFLDSFGGSAGNFQMFGNQFAGQGPYRVIIALARESMGDFSMTTGTLYNTQPDKGQESQVIGTYAKDVMAYWQLKFGNIWNSLVLYGTSGQSYTINGAGGQVDSTSLNRTVIAAEETRQAQEADATGEGESSEIKVHLTQLAAFKTEIPKAPAIDFFQTESQSKLAIALTARDQAGFEFYCDTTGDIIFKPPFYNLNVIPNKPVSWIQDYEIISDSISDSEAEVYTHITASGNAFSGGSTDYGLNTDITTPRAGVYDYHLLRRYGWRRLDYQAAWASNPRQLFFHLIDYLDRVNSKRQNGSITIPMRPELRMGFPIWIPSYDSFFYIQGISHNYSVGGQATTTLNLTAKRSKFIAPDNIGKITRVGTAPTTASSPSQNANAGTAAAPNVVPKPSGSSSKAPKNPPKAQVSYRIDFPDEQGSTSNTSAQAKQFGSPQQIRDPDTGKLLGFPNAVMVFRKPYNGNLIDAIAAKQNAKQNQKTKQALQNSGNMAGAPNNQKQKVPQNYDNVQGAIMQQIAGQQKQEIIQRLRAHRYEAGMVNFGGYDYAWDTTADFKEIALIPVSSVIWGEGTNDPKGATSPQDVQAIQAQLKDKLKGQLVSAKSDLDTATSDYKQASQKAKKAQDAWNAVLKKNPQQNGQQLSADLQSQKQPFDDATAAKQAAAINLKAAQDTYSAIAGAGAGLASLPSLNMLVRPVSDEFGFEVIGHYRYGRSAFIDRGFIQTVGDTGSNIANKINTSFAATGGLLTDGPKADPNGHTSADFAHSFDSMSPEDYVTGATFDHGTSSKDGPQNVQMIGQNTYNQAIKTAEAREGTAVYTDADAIRRGITLDELKPTVETGISEGVAKCACQLGRTDWLSVLPQDQIRSIINRFNVQALTPAAPNSTAGQDITAATNNPPASAVTAKVDYQDFFTILNQFLVEKFETDYQDNQEREAKDIGGADLQFDPSTGAVFNQLGIGDASEGNNILGDPQDPLFTAAEMGDPAAFEALSKQANFNFGLTDNAINQFNQVMKQQISLGQNLIKNLPPEFQNSIVGVAQSQLQSTVITQKQQALADAKEAASAAARDLRQDPGSDVAIAAYAEAQKAATLAEQDLLTTQNAQNKKSQALDDLQASVLSLQDHSTQLAQTLVNAKGNPAISSDTLADLEKQLQDSNNLVQQAQQALLYARSSPRNDGVSALYQIPIARPTQTGVLNPSKFGPGEATTRGGVLLEP